MSLYQGNSLIQTQHFLQLDFDKKQMVDCSQ